MAESGFPKKTIPGDQIQGRGADPKVGPGVQKTVGEGPKREPISGPESGTRNGNKETIRREWCRRLSLYLALLAEGTVLLDLEGCTGTVLRNFFTWKLSVPALWQSFATSPREGGGKEAQDGTGKLATAGSILKSRARPGGQGAYKCVKYICFVMCVF